VIIPFGGVKLLASKSGCFAGKDTVMEYRRKKTGSDTWHFCKNCGNWPTKDYLSRYDKPTTGELCDQCRAKEASGNCSK
jgi:hypothetical protein